MQFRRVDAAPERALRPPLLPFRESLAAVDVVQGFQQREIQESAYRLQRQAETKDRVVVGVNQFDTGEQIEPEIMRVSPEVGRRRAEELTKLKADRDQPAVDASLERIRAASQTDENLMPLLIEAVEAYASVGEICTVLREEWGEYREVLTI